jgi:mRNA interferase MazF
VKRGEIWTVAAGSGYAGKPRPAVLIQDDRFDTNSITVCALTTNPVDTPSIRLLIEPSHMNGLAAASRLMVDKIMTVPRTKLGRRVGQLSDEDTVRLNNAIVVFLGLAG